MDADLRNGLIVLVAEAVILGVICVVGKV
eukprot:SAG31_NODE_28617_length_407_cov_1.175325_1_plen_28_part_01